LEIVLLSWRWTPAAGFPLSGGTPKPPRSKSSCRRGEFLVASSGAAIGEGKPWVEPAW